VDTDVYRDVRVYSPVERLTADPAEDAPESGIALCLSGGGYRAMVFHLGALIRLNELGYLPRLARVSSVSGGSITAGVLALHWKNLNFDDQGIARDFQSEVTAPIRKLASKTIDATAVLEGLLLPGTVADKVRTAYQQYLFGHATLQDIPDSPRFVFNATNVQSLVLWRFSKPYMRDYRVGEVKTPTVELAMAVAASSAFPPVLSPAELSVEATAYTPESGLDLQREPYTTDVTLTDGGVYDNLGLETAWKRYDTILVSDGGGAYAAEPEPKHDWARHSYRVLSLIDNQVRSLRKRQVIASFRRGDRQGTYWGIRTQIGDYGLPDSLPCPPERTSTLAETPTRLKRLEPEQQERLINWGYAICDAAMRTHVLQAAIRPAGFPYPAVGV
jgi:NTE family protein